MKPHKNNMVIKLNIKNKQHLSGIFYSFSSPTIQLPTKNSGLHSTGKRPFKSCKIWPHTHY